MWKKEPVVVVVKTGDGVLRLIMLYILRFSGLCASQIKFDYRFWVSQAPGPQGSLFLDYLLLENPLKSHPLPPHAACLCVLASEPVFFFPASSSFSLFQRSPKPIRVSGTAQRLCVITKSNLLLQNNGLPLLVLLTDLS